LIDGVLTTIDVRDPQANTAINTINSQGQIGGRYNDAQGRQRGFVGMPVGN
jgi:hypothetical protein